MRNITNTNGPFDDESESIKRMLVNETVVDIEAVPEHELVREREEGPTNVIAAEMPFVLACVLHERLLHRHGRRRRARQRLHVRRRQAVHRSLS